MPKKKKSRSVQPKQTHAPRRPCPICDGTKVPNTDEDVQPLWLLDELKRAKGQNLLRSKLRICDTCNGSMNQQFEDKVAPLVKPMLSGQPATLTPAQQKLFSAWFCKTAALVALQNVQQPFDPNAPRAGRLQNRDHGRDMLRHIRNHGEPPPNTTVRIGRVDVDLGETLSGSETWNFLPPAPMPQARYQLSVVYGDLYAEVVVFSPASDLPAYDVLRTRMGNNDWLSLVWPTQVPSAVWPPPRPLSPKDYAALSVIWGVLYRDALTLARATTGGPWVSPFPTLADFRG